MQGKSTTPAKSICYEDYVVRVISLTTKEKGLIDQVSIRTTVGLASSYLILDTTTLSSSSMGVQTWMRGFHKLVDVMLALHTLGTLELETVNTASRSCSDCWSLTSSFAGLEEARAGVRGIAARLQGILDPNGTEYKGEKVYVP